MCCVRQEHHADSFDYSVHDTSKWEEFKLIDIKPKERGEYDVDIKIEFCGVCGSDVRFL